MGTTLHDEIKQTKPFKSLEEEAQLNIVRTSALLLDDAEQLFRPYGITATQYNVLRILRGSEPGGLCRNELRDRMLTRMPDMTRLLDRMEDAGLVIRAREDEDRRMVRSRISTTGLHILSELDSVVLADQRQRYQHLSAEQLRTLIEILTTVRQKR